MSSLILVAMVAMAAGSSGPGTGGAASPVSPRQNVAERYGVSAGPQSASPPQRVLDPSSFGFVYGNNNVQPRSPGGTSLADPSSFGYAHGDNRRHFVHPNTTTEAVPPSTSSPPPHRHGPRCCWIPDHYEWRTVVVWVPEAYYRQYHPDRYEYRLVNGFAVSVLVQREHYETVYVPGHYERHTRWVWVAGYWRCGW